MLKNILRKFLFTISLVAFAKVGLFADQSFIIGFYKTPSSAEKMLIENHKGTIKHTYTLLPAFAVTLPKESIDKLKADPLVKYIEEDKSVKKIKNIVKKSARFYTPNGLSQSDMSSDEYQNSLGVSKINSKIAHDKNITGKGVKIAILDTGINYNHQDLKQNYKGGYNFVNNDKNSTDPYDDGWNAHGTHMAGIISAKRDGVGVVGVAPEASIYAVKVLDAGGFGAISDIILGIEWAVSNDMDIANISISGDDSIMLKAACDAAQKAGLLIIAAAGNSYGELASYPALYESVVAVGSVDGKNELGFFSPIDEAIEIVAPGLEIQSTSKDNLYDILSGTSQSTAFVTGVAALIISSGVSDINEDGEINGLDVRKKLQTSALDLGEIGRDNKFGYGLVDVSNLSSISPLPGDDSYEQGYKDAQDAGFAEGKDDSCGYEIWNIDANLTYDTKYNDGYAVGYIEAYDRGWESCRNEDNNSSDNNSSSYDNGFKDAQTAGFAEGRDDSCSNDVWSIGVFLKFDTSYDNGYGDGYIKAYDEGWESCRSEEDKLSYDEGFKASQQEGALKGKSDSCADRAWSIDVELDYNNKYNEGYADGYIKAYDEAWESDKSDCQSM